MEQQPTDAFGYFWFRFQAPGSIGARDDTTYLFYTLVGSFDGRLLWRRKHQLSLGQLGTFNNTANLPLVYLIQSETAERGRYFINNYKGYHKRPHHS